MKTYKNLETYQLAFNLAIKIYNLNISLPRQLLIRYGNRLRWSSLKIKDMITEAYANGDTNTPDGKTLEDATNLCNEIVSHLINIRAGYQRGSSVEKLIIGYQALQFKIAKSNRNVKKIFQDDIPDHPALKGWESHEPSTQYRQVG